MFQTVEGLYKNGKVELFETPRMNQAKVLVTFLAPESMQGDVTPMVFGQFAGARQSSDEDFRSAEWRDETLNGD